MPHRLSKQPNHLIACRCTWCRTEHPSASSVAPNHRWTSCLVCDYFRQHNDYECSLEMKKAHEYFSSSCGAGALDIKAPYRRRASCDHSDKAGFDDAFRETHSKMQPKNAHRLEAGRPRRLACRARSQKLLTTGSCELYTSRLPQGWRQVEKKYHVSLRRRTSGSTATSIYGHPRLKQYQRPENVTQREKHEDEML